MMLNQSEDKLYPIISKQSNNNFLPSLYFNSLVTLAINYFFCLPQTRHISFTLSIYEQGGNLNFDYSSQRVMRAWPNS